MPGSNMISITCSQDFQVRPTWSWRWTRENPLVASFQYLQACARVVSLGFESFFMRIKSSWCLKNLGFLCQQNGFCGEKLVGLHTAFIKLLWKHVNWQSTCWDLPIYTMISENQNHSPSEVMCTGISDTVYWDHVWKILETSHINQHLVFSRMTSEETQRSICTWFAWIQPWRLPLLALQGLPFVLGLLADTSPIHAGIALAPHGSHESMNILEEWRL